MLTNTEALKSSQLNWPCCCCCWFIVCSLVLLIFILSSFPFIALSRWFENPYQWMLNGVGAIKFANLFFFCEWISSCISVSVANEKYSNQGLPSLVLCKSRCFYFNFSACPWHFTPEFVGEQNHWRNRPQERKENSSPFAIQRYGSYNGEENLKKIACR